MRLMLEDPEDKYRVESWEINHGYVHLKIITKMSSRKVNPRSMLRLTLARLRKEKEKIWTDLVCSSFRITEDTARVAETAMNHYEKDASLAVAYRIALA